jgi:predicted methyltransferase
MEKQPLISRGDKLLSITKQKDLFSKVARKVFEEATVTSLGSTFHIIIAFHLKQKFNRDPYEVFITDPKTFYNGLKEVLGAGAEAVITLVGTFLTVKYHTNHTAREFVELFTNGEPQRQELSKIFENIVNQEEKKIKTQ